MLAFLHVPNISFIVMSSSTNDTMQKELKHIHLYVSIIFPTLRFVFTLCNLLHCALIFFCMFRIASPVTSVVQVQFFYVNSSLQQSL